MIEMIKFNHQNKDHHQRVVTINLNIQLFLKPVQETDRSSEWGGGKQNNMQTNVGSSQWSQLLMNG